MGAAGFAGKGVDMSDVTKNFRGPYLIESSPNYQKYLAAKLVRESMERLLHPFTAAVAGYRDELRRALDAPAIYLGPGE